MAGGAVDKERSVHYPEPCLAVSLRFCSLARPSSGRVEWLASEMICITFCWHVAPTALYASLLLWPASQHPTHKSTPSPPPHPPRYTCGEVIGSWGSGPAVSQPSDRNMLPRCRTSWLVASDRAVSSVGPLPLTSLCPGRTRAPVAWHSVSVSSALVVRCSVHAWA